MMFEAVQLIKKLFTGEVVKWDGDHFFMESARLYTIPDEPVPVYIATAGPLNAKRTGKYADGIITVGAADEKITMLWDKFREGAEQEGKDASAMRTQLQVHVSWAPTQEEAERNALEEWPNGGMPFPKQDIKNPEDFANIAKLVRIESFANRMLISADLDEHTEQIQRFVDMGFDEVYLHNVGRDQAAFIRTFSEKVLPNLKLS
jgi:coenzyme F420-dependent glucose-6-phosphate dehydrogenase